MTELGKAMPVITVDGPGGSGKGTVSQIIAQKLGWHLLDSGALYRLVALAAKHHDVDINGADEASLATLAEHLDVQFLASEPNEPTRVILEGEDVSNEVRTEECGSRASVVAAKPSVRQALLRRQRAFAELPGLVADGRDMGTVVFTGAPVKVYLTASANERAKRRYKQLKDKGLNVSLADLLEDIQTRDERDMNRAIAPLKPAEDAIMLDSTSMSIEEVVDVILAEAKKHF